jgi:hypothetical protein
MIYFCTTHLLWIKINFAKKMKIAAAYNFLMENLNQKGQQFFLVKNYFFDKRLFKNSLQASLKIPWYIRPKS